MSRNPQKSVPYRMALIEICSDLGIPKPQVGTADLMAWSVEQQASYLIGFNDRYLRGDPGRQCSSETVAQIFRSLGYRPFEIYAIGTRYFIGTSYRPAGSKLAYFVQAEGSSASNVAANLLRKIYGYNEIDPRTGQSRMIIEPLGWDQVDS